MNRHRDSNVSHGIIETPPPEYESHDNISSLHRVLSEATVIEDHNNLGRRPARSNNNHRKHRHRTSKHNRTVTTAADVLATSVSAEALLLSPPLTCESNVMMAERASSPMSPVTHNLTSVEINTVCTEADISLIGNGSIEAEVDISPSRFSSNSINTVILNPGAMAASAVGYPGSSAKDALTSVSSTNSSTSGQNLTGNDVTRDSEGATSAYDTGSVLVVALPDFTSHLTENHDLAVNEDGDDEKTVSSASSPIRT